MPVEYQVDSLDSVDESIRGAYVETDGKFNFDPDKYADLKAQGLKTKNKELLTKIAQGKADKDALKRFEKFADLDDDELSDLLTLREQKNNPPADKDKDKGKGAEELQANFDKALKKATDKHTTDLAERDNTITELNKKLKHYELTVPIRDVAAQAGVLAEDMKLVLLETASRFKLNDDGKIVVLDDDGEETDITPQKFFDTLYKQQRPKFYAPSGAGGSGAPSSTSRSGVEAMRRADFDKLGPVEAAKFMQKVRDGKASLVD